MNRETLWLIAGDSHKTGQGESTIEHYKALQDYAEKQFRISEMVYRWTAQDITMLDKLPYIGPISKHEENVFVATGFRKWGMTHGTIAAEIISDKILQNNNPFKSSLYTGAIRSQSIYLIIHKNDSRCY